MKIQLDMYQTIAVAVVVLMLGKFLKKRCSVLERFCIPAPVIGGVLFAIFTCICYATGIAEFEFDDILKEVCMVFFFTSVGFQANLKVLKSGGKSLIVFLGLVVVLIVTQNFMAIGLSKLLHISPLVGLCTMTSDHWGKRSKYALYCGSNLWTDRRKHDRWSHRKAVVLYDGCR